MTIVEEIKKLRESSKKRNFTQRFDLVVTFKDMDIKKPENQVDELLFLPKIPGKPPSITIFSDSVKKMEKARVVSGSEIEKIAKDKKQRKDLINNTSLFLSEPKLMPIVGKHLGRYLAPINRMPTPVVGDLKENIGDYQKAIRISIKKHPMIQLPVGSEDMDDKDVGENIKKAVNFLQKKLPRGRNNISNVYLKLTMSKPIKLEAW